MKRSSPVVFIITVTNATKPSTYTTPTIAPPDQNSSTFSSPATAAASSNADGDALCSAGLQAKTQAAFVSKLYKMLQDPSIQQLISWADSGDRFSVPNPSAFSRYVLPQYFKHNNWQSFVRQLNMYGFHKVNDMIHSNLVSEGQTWEFRHPHFRRGAVDDLQNIKRKNAKSHHQTQVRPMPWRDPENTDDDCNFSMYNRVLFIEGRLQEVTCAYKMLQSETVQLRSIVSKQQETIQDIVDMISVRQAGSNAMQPTNAERIRQRSMQLKDASSNTTGCSSPSSVTSTIDAAWLSSAQRAQSDIHPHYLAHRLPSIESVQTQNNTDDMNSSILKPPTGYSHLDFAGYEEPTDNDMLGLKRPFSYVSPASANELWKMEFSGAPINPQCQHNIANMGLGKESRLLNPMPMPLPMDDQEQRQKRQH